MQKKTLIGQMAPNQPPGPAPAAREVLSPEEADRVATSFVPLWQADQAPFEARPAIAIDDPRGHTGPLAAPVALQLPPVVTAPIQPVATEPVRSPSSPDDAPPGTNGVSGAAADLRPAPLSAPHQPIPERAPDPELPSVIVESSNPNLPAVAPAPAAAAPPPKPQAEDLTPFLHAPPPAAVAAPAPAVVASPVARPREPRTDPPSVRARNAAPPAADVDTYSVPAKSRTPLIIGAVVGSAALIFLVYAVSSRSSAPTTPPAQVTAAARPVEPAVNIPPPSTEEAPSPPAPTTTPAAPPAPVKATTSHSTTPSTPSPAAPPAVAPQTPVATPSHHSKPKNPSTSGATGGIVRDNPF